MRHMKFTRKTAIVAFTAAALGLTTAGTVPTTASAAMPFSLAQKVQAAEPENVAALTEFSSQRRKVRRNYRNDAAAAAAITAIIGGIASYAAAREYRKAQERRYRYYAAPYGYHRPYHHRRGYYRHW